MLGGVSIWQLLIVLAIIIMIFGTKKLRSLGGDLGGAVKGFKKAMNDGADDAESGSEKSKQDDPKQLSQNQQSQDADFDKVKDQDKS